jgi:FkbM family methyltransferase
MVRKLARGLALLIPPIARLYDDRNRLRDEAAHRTLGDWPTPSEWARTLGDWPTPPQWARWDPCRANRYFYLGDGIALVFTDKNRPIFLSTRESHLALRLITEGAWEQGIALVIRRHLHPGDTVVEIGCNHGCHSLAICEEIGPSGKLYGFEANPRIFHLLNRTLVYNDFWPQRSLLFNFAAGNRVGEVPFIIPKLDIAGGWVARTDDPFLINPSMKTTVEQSVSAVEMRRLDDVLADLPKIDMLRMDVEGSEGNVILGGLKLIKRSPRLTIISEWDPGYLRRADSDPAEIADLLSSIGFRAAVINGDASLSDVDMSRLPTLEHCDLIFQKSAA